EPGRQQRYAGALRTFQLLQREFERFRCWRAAPPILVTRAMGEKILGARIEHGRSVIDRRIDESVIGYRVAAAGNDLGVGLPRPRRLFRFIVHPLPSWAVSTQFGRPRAR